jgi:hypothetical protein
MRRAGLLVAVALAACGEVAPDEPDAGAGTLELTLGTVDADGQGFLPLAGDQPLVPGSQGGFHVWLKYRVRNHVPGTVHVRRTARRVSDDRLVLRADGAVDLGAAKADGTWELAAPVPSFMCPSPLGVKVYDLPVRFTVELRDPETDAVLATATAEATPRCPPEHVEFCERICSG